MRRPWSFIVKTLCRDYWLYSLAAGLSGLLVFVGVYILQTPMWEASGVIRIGQTLQMGQTKSGVSVPLELGLLMSSEESQQLIRHGAWAAGENWAFRLRPLSDGIRPPPTTRLLDLKVQAPSAEHAIGHHEAILARLKVSHDEIFKQRQEFWANESVRLSRALEVGQKELMHQASLCGNFGDKSFKSRLLCANLLANERVRLDRLSSLHTNIQEKRQSSWTYPTDRLGDLKVSDGPVSPNFLLSVMLSVFSGGAVMVMLVVIGVVWRRTRGQTRPN